MARLAKEAGGANIRPRPHVREGQEERRQRPTECEPEDRTRQIQIQQGIHDSRARKKAAMELRIVTYPSGVVCSHNDCLCETVRCRDGAARGVRREMVASWTRTADAGCSSGEGSVGFSCLSVASLSVALESESASAVSISSRDERVSWKAMRGPILACPDWGGGRDEARGSNLKSKIRHGKGTAYRGRWTGVCWSSFTQRWLMFGEWAGVWPGLGAKLS